MKPESQKYYLEYSERIGKEIPRLVDEYDFSNKNGGFDYLLQASAVYSSNIEGNSIDLNSYGNYKLSPKNFKKEKEAIEIDNLVSAYDFARKNPLNEANFLKVHGILSELFLIKTNRGKYRTEPVGVFGETGLLYLAVEPEIVALEMEKFFDSVTKLINSKLDKPEAFYHASLIHLVCAHIHPFRDGNGRAARLLEKWFLATKLGADFWKIQSEKFYWNHRQDYYKNINLGVNFYELDYDKCLPFLTMLPESIKKK
jgi:Fic family protein